jgi:dsDNA-specific endonuclease/ATPase MutS2
MMQCLAATGLAQAKSAWQLSQHSHSCFQELQQETRAVEALEHGCQVHLEFRGINSDVATSALNRAAKGGVLTANGLLALAQISEAAGNLQQVMRKARSVAKGSRNAELVDILAVPYALRSMLHNLVAQVRRAAK